MTGASAPFPSRNPGEKEPSTQAVPTEMVARLLSSSVPHLASRGLTMRYEDAEDHVTVRLGEDHGASFPTVDRSPSFHPVSMAHLREAAPTWNFLAQVPVVIGEPEFGYRYRYSVFEWLPGSNALRSPLTIASARRLGTALAQLHQPAPPEAPQHAHVEVPLTWQSQAVYTLIDTVEAMRSPGGQRLDKAAARDAWDAALDFPHAPAHTWVHGALDPRVILSESGRFMGITHWREMARADPALDLTLAATALTAVGLEAMLDSYGRVDQPSVSIRIRAGMLARALRFVLSPQPALGQLGWTQLSEHGCLAGR